MARGGKREGAGRRPGTANVKTREVADKAAEDGVTPLDYMLGILRDETADVKRRDWAAEKAAPFMHPRLANVNAEVTGKDGGSITFSWLPPTKS